jgi:dephospho-CoA kinase
MGGLSRAFGLTGGIASGKSTVGRFFAELGAKVVDADQLGRELLRPSHPAYREIVERFGKEVLAPSGEVDRKRLGEMVFSNPEKLRVLNGILHPRIIERSEELTGQYLKEDPQSVVLVEAALIYEAGLAQRFAKIVVAWCRPEQQLERLMANTGVSREEAERRLAAQMSSEGKRRRADYVVDCSGSKENTRRQVEALYPELRKIAETAK